ncbi:MAG TPA: hypothetical protein VGN72_07825 [Tepidisphaeraceae bacterium]|jgi:hypothetical protein|nr:hypothetical protein [Tepidisphaeraceae bacterium]
MKFERNAFLQSLTVKRKTFKAPNGMEFTIRQLKAGEVQQFITFQKDASKDPLYLMAWCSSAPWSTRTATSR